MKRFIAIATLVVLIAYLLLLIPERESPVPLHEGPDVPKKPFVWNQDAFWLQLEKRFVEARRVGCDGNQHVLDSLVSSTSKTIRYVNQNDLQANDPAFVRLQNLVFESSPLIATCPDRFIQLREIVEESRKLVKRQSEHWNINAADTRETLYRLLYGGRAAVEEIMLQLPLDSTYDALSSGTDEPSATPWAAMLGVKIHSGDILISRGGAPTSALIARGNDFPGNFSHVALVYVHPKTRLVSIIESHIERGVTISTIEEYLRDTKLRVMILRLRSDLNQLQADPMLPHKAAELVLGQARQRHIPYDFEMDFENSDKWFCSEVASFAYRSLGVQLWMGLSHISSPGLRSWLGAFGVRHFETQEPSDLEYDPQLRVVAEWRDPATLRKDHVDNAVTEVMLEGAEAGERLTYVWYLLPVARVLKAYSSVLNLFGSEGPVPEGMSAAAALRNKFYSDRHNAIKRELTRLADDFERQKGFAPPFWDLVQMAQAARDAIAFQ